jgi:cathepsin X
MANHILSIVGWGKDDQVGKEYWILRNSWGTYWGVDGYGKIMMHEHNLGVENSCSWATPVPKKSDDRIHAAPAERTKTFTINRSVKPGTFFDYANSPRPMHPSTTSPTRVVSPLPKYEDAPASFDVRDVGGESFASPSRNQHIPTYCGSCWAHGPTSALNDRFQMANKNAFPHVFLSPQLLVNCMPPPADKTQGNGGCLGGDPSEVGPFLHDHGGVHETCQNYQAKNLYTDFKCDGLGVCRNCDPNKGCFAMGAEPGKNNFTKYYVDEFGRINSTDYAANAKQMIAEIGVRGPIACAVCVTPAFEAYTGGVFDDTTNCTSLDHSISIAGYGTENGTDYWIGRNSWGTYWGEDGWFRIVRGTNNLGVEKDCAWTTPGKIE